MGIPAGGEGACKGCGRTHTRPWGKYCVEVVKAKTHAKFVGEPEDHYQTFLFVELPEGCTWTPRVKSDEESDSDMENLDDKTGVLGAEGQTDLERHQALKIAALELELATVTDRLAAVTTGHHVDSFGKPLPVFSPAVSLPPMPTHTAGGG